MKKNDKVIVSDSAPHHKGRIGYFQFLGKGASVGCAVLSDQPNIGIGSMVLFAVAENHISLVSN